MNMKVYEAINKVQKDLAKTGISKDRRNEQQNYKFRGIDDVYGAISPLLATHGLCILPRMLTRVCEERQTKSGGMLFYVTVEAEFDFVSSEDGSKHTVKTFGEAMDSGDKATNKAMSAAYKYAAFQSFAIPTEGDNDADSTTHEVKKQNAYDLTDERIEQLQKDAAYMAECHQAGQDLKAIEYFNDERNFQHREEKLYVWDQLKDYSKLRSAINSNSKKGQA